MATFTVLGAGMMGSALCVPLIDGGHEVRLVGTHLDQEIVEQLRAGREHPTLRLALPETIRPYSIGQLTEATQGADYLVLGVSSAGARWAGEQIAALVTPDLPVFMITKGLHWDGERLLTMPELVRSCLPAAVSQTVAPAAVAGPCIAGELARRVPSCVVLTGEEPAPLERIAVEMRTSYYHVWTSRDLVGVEACAALKNAFAMGVAFGAGEHLRAGGKPGSVARHNVESAVFAQAIGEMGRIIELLGGERHSAVGLAGVGDLDVTNNGGRTGRFGALLGQGLPLEQAIERMAGATLECLEIIAVLRPAMRDFERRGLLGPGELPLLDHMAEVVLDGAPVDLPFSRFFSAGPRS